jgi:hypothetical protein
MNEALIILNLYCMQIAKQYEDQTVVKSSVIREQRILV